MFRHLNPADAIQKFLSSPSEENSKIQLLRGMEALRLQAKEALDLRGEEGGDQAFEVTQDLLASFKLNLEDLDLTSVAEVLDDLSSSEMKKATSGKDIEEMQAAAGRAGMLAQLVGYIEKNAPEPPEPSDKCRIM